MAKAPVTRSRNLVIGQSHVEEQPDQLNGHDNVGPSQVRPVEHPELSEHPEPSQAPDLQGIMQRQDDLERLVRTMALNLHELVQARAQPERVLNNSQPPLPAPNNHVAVQPLPTVQDHPA